MEKITIEEVMDKLDIFQMQIWKSRRIWLVGFRQNFNRHSYTINLNGVQRRMPNLQSSFDVNGSIISENEWTSRSFMENVA